MNNFIRYWIPIAVLAYLALVLLSAVLGEGAMLLGIILVAAALLALLVCILEKLAEMEKKLDALLKETHEESDEE